MQHAFLKNTPPQQQPERNILKEKNHSKSDYLTNLVFKPRVIIFIDIILHTCMGIDIGLDYFYNLMSI